MVTMSSEFKPFGAPILRETHMLIFMFPMSILSATRDTERNPKGSYWFIFEVPERGGDLFPFSVVGISAVQACS